jgi:hypothetical protein
MRRPPGVPGPTTLWRIASPPRLPYIRLIPRIESLSLPATRDTVRLLSKNLGRCLQ